MENQREVFWTATFYPTGEIIEFNSNVTQEEAGAKVKEVLHDCAKFEPSFAVLYRGESTADRDRVEAFKDGTDYELEHHLKRVGTYDGEIQAKKMIGLREFIINGFTPEKRLEEINKRKAEWEAKYPNEK